MLNLLAQCSVRGHIEGMNNASRARPIADLLAAQDRPTIPVCGMDETAERLSEALASGSSAADAMRAMRGTRLAKLGAAQRAEVRELVHDCGWDRAEALAAVQEDDGR